MSKSLGTILFVITILLIGLIGWRVKQNWQGNRSSKFPNQPIQIVVPYAAGGGSDTFARIFQQSLARNDTLSVPIVVVNRPGGSATIGSRFVKNSRPDGYRILCHHEGIIATKLAGTAPFGPEAFEPIAQTASKILLMIVRADSPYQSLPDLLSAAQKSPNTIRIGANQGSPAWFICKQMEMEYAGARFNYIPADGSKRIAYLLGGKLEAGIFSLDEYMANRNTDGRPLSENILAIANFSPVRHEDIPDVSTSQEQALETHAENSYYFWAPLGTNSSTIEILASALREAIEDPEVVKELKRLSIPPSFRKGAKLKRHLLQRQKAFEKIAVEADGELPNFAAWIISAVILLFVFVILERRWWPDSKESKFRRLNSRGLICLLITIGFVVALQMEIPYILVTPIVVFLLGATLFRWQPLKLVPLVPLALAVGLATETIFATLFKVPLP